MAQDLAELIGQVEVCGLIQVETIAREHGVDQMVVARAFEKGVEVIRLGDGEDADGAGAELEVGFLQVLVEPVKGMGLKGLALHAVVGVVATDFQAETDAVFSLVAVEQQHLVGADHQHAEASEVHHAEATCQGARAELHRCECFADLCEALRELTGAEKGCVPIGAGGEPLRQLKTALMTELGQR